MRQRFVQVNGELVPADQYTADSVAHHVIPDIEPFRDTTGAFITGRRAWREHLSANGLQEMGHSDVRAMQAEHAKKRAAYAERMAKASAQVSEVPQTDVINARHDRPRIAAEVLNRLHNRPTPPRKLLIKIALEEARRRR